MLECNNYYGPARLLVWVAKCVGCWPFAMFELYFEPPACGLRGLLIRWQQEVAILNGAAREEAANLYRM